MFTAQGAEASLMRIDQIPVYTPVQVVFGLHYIPRNSGRRRVAATIVSLTLG